MTDSTEQEACIGSLGQQKVYLHWSDVKDICTYAVSEAYEQVKNENTQLKELLEKWLPEFDCYHDTLTSQFCKEARQVLGEEE